MRDQVIGTRYNGLPVLAAKPRSGAAHPARFMNLTSAEYRASDFAANGYGTLIVRGRDGRSFLVLVNPEPSY